MRAMTRNISTGGVYFELDLTDGHAAPAEHSTLDVDLTVPPGDGHFPYEGRIRSTVEVLRCESLPRNGGSGASAPTRLGVAARFCEPLKYEF